MFARFLCLAINIVAFFSMVDRISPRIREARSDRDEERKYYDRSEVVELVPSETYEARLLKKAHRLNIKGGGKSSIQDYKKGL